MPLALRPLRTPAFRRLALGRFVDELGNWLGEIALAVLVFDRTGSALATTALFLALQFAPAFATPPLVARFEGIHSRAILPLLNLAQAAVFASLAVFASTWPIALVIGVTAVGAALALVGRTLTRAAAAAVLAPGGLLREGNALLNVGFTAGVAAGPVLGGLVVAGAGTRTALFADAGSFLAVALLIVTAPGLPRMKAGAGGWRERLREGLDYVRGRPMLGRLLTAQAAAWVFFTLVIPIEVVFVKGTLGAGDAGYGALLGSWGAGMVAGSFLFAALRRVPLRPLLVAGTLAIALAYFITGLAPTLAVACAAAVVGGTGNGIQWVSLMTAVQELTGTDYQARVISLLESLMAAMPGLGFLLGGGVAAIFNPRVSYEVAAAGVLVVLAAAAFALRRTDWGTEEVGVLAPARTGEIPAAATAPIPGGALEAHPSPLDPE